MTRISFDQNKVEGSGTFTPIPPGKYLLEISDSDVRPTKSGTGEYVYLVLRVVEGPHEGRLVFDRINYVNPNRQVEEIAQKALKRLCRLCGVRGELTDTQQLHFKRFEASVGIRADTGYGEQNQVRYPDVAVTGNGKVLPDPAPIETAPVKLDHPVKLSPQQRPAPSGGPWPWQKNAKF